MPYRIAAFPLAMGAPFPLIFSLGAAPRNGRGLAFRTCRLVFPILLIGRELVSTRSPAECSSFYVTRRLVLGLGSMWMASARASFG